MRDAGEDGAFGVDADPVGNDEGQSSKSPKVSTAQHVHGAVSGVKPQITVGGRHRACRSGHLHADSPEVVRQQQEVVEPDLAVAVEVGLACRGPVRAAR